MTSVTVTSGQVSATVVGNAVTATVPPQVAATATVTGGVGPAGPQGPVGAAGSNTLASLTDVQIDSAAAGDVLRYANGKWRDFPEQDIVIDGTNF